MVKGLWRQAADERRGAGGAVALAVLTLLVLVLLLLLRTPSEGGPQAEVSPGVEAAPSPLNEIAPSLDPLALRTEGGIETGLEHEWKGMEKSFEGLGTISGFIDYAPGLPPPREWVLSIRPSLFALGRERAEERSLTFPGNQLTFEVRDLPMGGYTVEALAEGMSSVAQELMLFKLADRMDLQGVDHVHVSLLLTARAVLEGVVLTHRSIPAEGVPVSIQRKGQAERREAKTGWSGQFRFPDLEEGTFVLRYGPWTRPLGDPVEVLVERPVTRLPDITLPVLYPIVLRAVDEQDRPLEGALVRGHGPCPIDDRTGFDGQLRVEHLPPGSYQVRIVTEDSGHEGRADFVILAKESEEPPLILVHCQLRR